MKYGISRKEAKKEKKKEIKWALINIFRMF